MVSTVTPRFPPDPATLSTIYGNREIGNGDHDGYRIDGGLWLDHCHLWGIEADYLNVSGKPDGYDSGLTSGFKNGVPMPVVRASIQPPTRAVTATLPIYNFDLIGFGGYNTPPVYVGRITVDTSDYFQSAGLWLRRQLLATEWSTCGDEVCWTDASARTFRLDALGGYRYARLIDAVNERDETVDVFPGYDQFTGYNYVNNCQAANDFNGADLGLNGVYTAGRFSLDVLGKMAFGLNNQMVTLYNLNVVNGSNNPNLGTITRSALSQEFSRDRFSVIPELTLTGGYQVTDHVKVTAGYDLLYWSAVVRAANQIPVDPKTGYPYGVVVGARWQRLSPGTRRTSLPRACAWAPSCGSKGVRKK